MDTEEMEKIIKKVRIRAKYIEAAFSDDELADYIDEVHQKVLNYLNVKKLPQELLYILVNMCVDYLRYVNAQQNEDNPDAELEIDLNSISSVNIGDTSVDIGEGNSNSLSSKDLKSHYSNLDDIIFNYRAQLNMFRRLRW